MRVSGRAPNREYRTRKPPAGGLTSRQTEQGCRSIWMAHSRRLRPDRTMVGGITVLGPPGRRGRHLPVPAPETRRGVRGHRSHVRSREVVVGDSERNGLRQGWRGEQQNGNRGNNDLRTKITFSFTLADSLKHNLKGGLERPSCVVGNLREVQVGQRIVAGRHHYWRFSTIGVTPRIDQS